MVRRLTSNQGAGALWGIDIFLLYLHGLAVCPIKGPERSKVWAYSPSTCMVWRLTSNQGAGALWGIDTFLLYLHGLAIRKRGRIQFIWMTIPPAAGRCKPGSDLFFWPLKSPIRAPTIHGSK
jgi:hypothetical protein